MKMCLSTFTKITFSKPEKWSEKSAETVPSNYVGYRISLRV
jgi:hypothetical protein